MYEFGSVYTAGTLGSNSTMFDGLACNDTNLTPQVQKKVDAGIAYQMAPIAEKLN
jgi:hypothetical protein